MTVLHQNVPGNRKGQYHWPNVPLEVTDLVAYVAEERRDPKVFQKVPIAESVRLVGHLPLDRYAMLQVLHSGCASEEAFLTIAQGPLDDLQGLLAALVPNSLPDDGDCVWGMRLRDDRWLHITCKLRHSSSGASAALVCELQQGWVYRAHSLAGSCVFANTEAPAVS